MRNWHDNLSPFGRWYSTTTSATFVLFIPSGSDSLITSDGNTFKVVEVISPIPAGAIQDRDGDYIFDRFGNYIEVRT